MTPLLAPILAVMATQVLFYLFCGYLALFRAARHPGLSARRKLAWMLALALLPEAAFAWFLGPEASRRMRFAGLFGGFLALTVLALLAQALPPAALAARIAQLAAPRPALHNFARDVTAYHESSRKAWPENPERLHDALTREAELVNQTMFAQFKTTRDPDHKEALDEADIALSHIRWTYTHTRLSERDYAVLLRALERLTQQHEITLDEEHDWARRVDATVSASEAQMFRARHAQPAASPVLRQRLADLRHTADMAARQLLESGLYDRLDALADELRSHDERFPGGTSRLHALYAGLGRIDGDDAAAQEQRLAALEAWRAARPASVAAPLAIAQFHLDAAWKARGTSAVTRVPRSSYARYVQGFNAAYADVQRLDPSSDPEVFRVLMELGFVAGGTPQGNEDLGHLYQAAVARFPDFPGYYRLRAWQLSPKWFGEAADAPAYFRTLLSLPDRERGQLALAQALIAAIPHYDGADLVRMAQLPWSEVKAAFAALERRYGPASEEQNALMLLAETTGDRATMAEAADRIGDTWEKNYYPSESAFAAAAAWAHEPVARPVDPTAVPSGAATDPAGHP